MRLSRVNHTTGVTGAWFVVEIACTFGVTRPHWSCLTEAMAGLDLF